ncbi:hypothetical protein [Naasia lichenicola]|nr:hypothetical protein [Naasia lichenicola]
MLIIAILLTWCLVSVGLGLGIGHAMSLSEKSRPRLTRSNFDSAA